MLCLLLNIVVLVVAIIVIAILGELAIRQIPQPYQKWMWIIRLLGCLILLVVAVEFFFGGNEVHMIKIC